MSSPDTGTAIGIATAVATPFAGAIGYLTKRLFQVLSDERETTQLERARGDRLEAEVFKIQAQTITGLEALTSTVKEQIALVKDRRRDVS